MTTQSRAGLALAAAVASAIGLAGCAPGKTEDAMRATIEQAVVSVDHVTGAYVSFSSSGPADKELLVNIYVDTDDNDIVAATADEALRTMWHSVGIRPLTVSISVAAIPKPDDAWGFEGNALDAEPIAEALGIPDVVIVRQLITIPADAMDDRYGEWSEPAA